MDPRTSRRSVGPGLAALALTTLLLGGAGRAAAVTFTVGDDEPGADFTSVQDAIDAALATGGGFREVRVAAGYYVEHLSVELPAAGGWIDVTGGWDPTFSFRSADPSVTVIDGVGDGSVLAAKCLGGRLWLRGLTLTGGKAPERGGGADVRVSGDCVATFDHVRFYRNEVESAAAGSVGLGGGLAASLHDQARVEVLRCAFAENRVVAADGGATGGGLWAAVQGASALEIAGDPGPAGAVDFIGNLVEGGGGVRGAALAVLVSAPARAEIRDTRVVDNRAASTASFPDLQQGMAVELGGDGTFRFVRNDVRGTQLDAPNLSPPPGAPGRPPQMAVLANGEAEIRLSDSFIGGSTLSGLSVLGFGDVLAEVTNLTVAGNAFDGLRVGAGGTFGTASGGVSNNIAALNGGINYAVGGLPERSNWTSALDPGFVDPASGDYHLAPGTAAVDAGTPTPPGGLGAVDLDFHPRVVGASVDQGAYELQEPAGGGGNGRCAILGGLIGNTSPVCRCLTDATLRELRCGFFAGDLFVDLRTPFPIAPGQSFEAGWTVQPWTGVEGPLEMEAALLVGGQEIAPLGAVKISPPKLKDGKLSGGSLEVRAPLQGGTLRAVVRYRPAGSQEVRELALDAELPVGGFQEK